MRDKRLIYLLISSLIAPALLSFSDPAHALASSKSFSVIEGTEQRPAVEVIRVDENGEEITEENADSSGEEENTRGSTGSKENASGENASGETGAGYENAPIRRDTTYEQDKMGYIYDEDTESALNSSIIYIETPEDMEELAKNCRLDTWSAGKHVILENDIDLENTSFAYIPIFGGVFDGQGHTISGFKAVAGESYTGMFCIVQQGALIENLHIKGTMILSGNQLANGGIAGDNYGVIRGCSFSGTIEGYDYTGGIAGYNEQTGIISCCTTSGDIKGLHFTGGIAGYNLGSISSCTNNATVNIKAVDDSFEKKDFDISTYAQTLQNLFGDNNKTGSTSVLESTIDTGGICGYSQGTITSCNNSATVGYEHVGYNVGGIVGRQNGYVDMCTNDGEVFGRKDVGGIVGQAEPYVIVDISDDVIEELTTNMNSLHDLVNITLNDAGDESDLISSRLNLVKGFADKAIDDTSYLTNETHTWINGVMDGGNELLNRLHYTISESSKSGGVIELTSESLSDASNSFASLKKAANDLNLKKYMTEQEKADYDEAVANIEKATADYESYIDKYTESEFDYEYYKYIDDHHNDPAYSSSTSKLVPVDAEGNIIDWPGGTLSGNKAAYANIAKVVRIDTSTDPATQSDFPSSGEYAEADAALDTEARASAATEIEILALEEFQKNYGMSYALYLETNLNVMTNILMTHLPEITAAEQKDLSNAVNAARQSMSNLKSAVSEIGSIASNLSGRGAINMPKLSAEYKDRSNSLVASIQGMSDNLGMLNNELNSSNQQLVDDMVKVNDQFNAVMLLLTDAIEDLLNQTDQDLYTDNSLAVAENCTDGTVADSVNNAEINGDINTSGIAGTMAIEYDFDLESDVTGIKDVARGNTYRTKCVMRNNRNEGDATVQKSYVGGICGYQEMGTILRCQNYGKMTSTTGDYVGGISGESMSTIHNSYAKGILKGRNYVGGICGKGYDIVDCAALPNINGEDEFLGAIAGDNSSKGKLTGNVFVCDDYAGIDRVSFSGKAEPLTYKELIAIPSVPSEFKSLRVTFVLDDETLAMEKYNYGDKVDSLPISIAADKYIIWDWESSDLDELRCDEELIGTSARYLTTLAGVQLRENGQSAVLVDGRFEQQDQLKTYLNAGSGDPKILEDWTVNIPKDYQPRHLVRYCPPDDVEDVRIWIVENGKRSSVGTTKMGKYYTFDTKGSTVNFVVEDMDSHLLQKYAPYMIGGGIVLLLLIIVLIASKRRRNKPYGGRGMKAADSDAGDTAPDEADASGAQDTADPSDTVDTSDTSDSASASDTVSTSDTADDPDGSDRS
ncbi:MAG: hypothetical protein K6E33_01335 [Lachnospiraceae bacterium]|nr:hypothetical protein [Lachnospiraceae bacterium]